MIRQLAKLIRVLNSETEPINVSLAVCFGMVVGFTQIWSVHNLVILLIVLFFRVNLSAFIIGTVVFKSISVLLSGVFHKIGLMLLTADFYYGFGTYLFNTTFWRFDRVNNTVMAGSIVVAIISFLPMVFLLNYLIKKYRKHILSYVKNTKFAKAIISSNIYHYYRKFTSIREAL